MSFWVPGKKKDGKRMLYSISVSWGLMIVIVTILISLLLPLIQSLRD